MKTSAARFIGAKTAHGFIRQFRKYCRTTAPVTRLNPVCGRKSCASPRIMRGSGKREVECAYGGVIRLKFATEKCRRESPAGGSERAALPPGRDEIRFLLAKRVTRAVSDSSRGELFFHQLQQPTACPGGGYICLRSSSAGLPHNLRVKQPGRINRPNVTAPTRICQRPARYNNGIHLDQ